MDVQRRFRQASVDSINIQIVFVAVSDAITEINSEPCGTKANEIIDIKLMKRNFTCKC